MSSHFLQKDDIVYHNIMVHWGKGVVLGKTEKLTLGCRGYHYVKAYNIEFKDISKVVKCKRSELRKTQNKKRLELIKKLYKGN